MTRTTPAGPPDTAPKVHLVDATYELFRAHFSQPSRRAPDGQEVGAVRGLVLTLLALVRNDGATHIGCATDRVVRSFRNDLYAGYKTEEGVPPELMAQFPLAEEAIEALGMVLWPMVEFEADDALGTAAARYSKVASQVLIASPDKDMAQCVIGQRVVMLDRKNGVVIDEPGVRAKWGVGPASIPDWLALVGDSADGYPGLPGWGEKSASTLLAEYGHIDAIPDDEASWKVKVRGAARLAATLRTQRPEAALFRRLATLRDDAPVRESLADLEWRGALPSLRGFTERLGFPDVVSRVMRWRSA